MLINDTNLISQQFLVLKNQTCITSTTTILLKFSTVVHKEMKTPVTEKDTLGLHYMYYYSSIQSFNMAPFIPQ